MRARQEFQIAALCHLFNAIPLWGLFFCGCVWFALREESRVVVRQAREGIVFHGFIMLILLAWSLGVFAARVLGVLAPWISGVLMLINNTMVILFGATYALVCLYGFFRCYTEQSFHYPLLGPRTK